MEAPPPPIPTIGSQETEIPAQNTEFDHLGWAITLVKTPRMTQNVHFRATRTSTIAFRTSWKQRKGWVYRSENSPRPYLDYSGYCH